LFKSIIIKSRFYWNKYWWYFSC